MPYETYLGLYCFGYSEIEDVSLCPVNTLATLTLKSESQFCFTEYYLAVDDLTMQWHLEVSQRASNKVGQHGNIEMS